MEYNRKPSGDWEKYLFFSRNIFEVSVTDRSQSNSYFKFKYSKYTKKWCCPHLWYNQGTTGSFLGDESISNSCSNKHRYTIWLLSSFLTFFFHYSATFFSYFVECNLLKMMHITSKKKKYKRSRSTTSKLFNLISFSGQD